MQTRIKFIKSCWFWAYEQNPFHDKNWWKVNNSLWRKVCQFGFSGNSMAENPIKMINSFTLEKDIVVLEEKVGETSERIIKIK